MASFLHPGFEGVFSPRRLAPDLFDRLAERVRTGLFPGAPASRNRYEIERSGQRSFRFRSASVLTGINVGLNRVELIAEGQGVRYKVTYWTWARYVIFLSLGLVGAIAAFMLPPVLGLDWYPEEWMAPTDQILWFGLPMLVFWGLVFPWILIVSHRRPAARCLESLLTELNGASEDPGR